MPKRFNKREKKVQAWDDCTNTKERSDLLKKVTHSPRYVLILGAHSSHIDRMRNLQAKKITQEEGWWVDPLSNVLRAFMSIIA